MGGCAHKQPLLNGFVEVGKGASALGAMSVSEDIIKAKDLA